MADVLLTLLDRSYIATKRLTYSTEVVAMDGGNEHRNSRWSAPLAEWDVVIPWKKRNSAEVAAAEALFAAVSGSWLTFDFHDTAADPCVDVEARIVDDTLDYVADGNLVQISFTVREVRPSGDSP